MSYLLRRLLWPSAALLLTLGLPPASAQSTQLLLQADGSLEEGDTVVPEDGSFYDLHTFDGEAGQRVAIAMDSQEFDTFLWLFGPDGQELAQNDDDDDAITANSAIAITLPQTGTYTIVANSHGEGMVGAYQVTVRTLE